MSLKIEGIIEGAEKIREKIAVELSGHTGLAGAVEEIQRAAHKLKGAAGSFGAIRLHQMCLDLEIWSGNDEEFQGFEEALEEEFRAVVSALHRHLQSS